MRLIPFYFLCLVSAVVAAETGGFYATLDGCNMSEAGGECRISWTAPAKLPSNIFVERFERLETSDWHRVAAAASKTPRRSEPVPGGQLYRVVACSAPESKDCVASTAIWAPAFPPDVSGFPETVALGGKDNPDGGVSKGLSYAGQQQQHSVYLVERLVNSIADPRRLPPMTPPLVDPFKFRDPDLAARALMSHDPTEAEIMHFVIYGQYEGRRRHGH